jgi:hypothetical protein
MTEAHRDWGYLTNDTAYPDRRSGKDRMSVDVTPDGEMWVKAFTEEQDDHKRSTLIYRATISSNNVIKLEKSELPGDPTSWRPRTADIEGLASPTGKMPMDERTTIISRLLVSFAQYSA